MGGIPSMDKVEPLRCPTLENYRLPLTLLSVVLWLCCIILLMQYLILWNLLHVAGTYYTVAWITWITEITVHKESGIWTIHVRSDNHSFLHICPKQLILSIKLNSWLEALDSVWKGSYIGCSYTWHQSQWRLHWKWTSCWRWLYQSQSHWD